MATATSSPVALGLIALALATTGCAGNSKPGASASSGPQPQGEPGRTTSAAALVRGPTATPAGWRTVRIDNGAAMPYPPGWHLVAGDAGTATAVLPGPHHEFLGYLNLTPRQGEESLRNWTAFRVAHDAREGDRSVKTLAVGRRLRFRNPGSVRTRPVHNDDRRQVYRARLPGGGPESNFRDRRRQPTAELGSDLPVDRAGHLGVHHIGAAGPFRDQQPPSAGTRSRRWNRRRQSGGVAGSGREDGHDAGGWW